MAKWFTSDHHFGHGNIIRYCNRPFQSIDEMNEEMVKRHNALVAPDDLVYFLGDVSLSKSKLHYVERMHGRKVLVMGNHDEVHPCRGAKAGKHFDAYFKVFGFVCETEQLTLSNGREVLLHHMPYTGDHHGTEVRYAEYRPKDNGLWLLHGHVHTTWRVRDRMLNVGVDQWAFAPVSEAEVIAEIDKAEASYSQRDKA